LKIDQKPKDSFEIGNALNMIVWMKILAWVEVRMIIYVLIKMICFILVIILLTKNTSTPFILGV
jgi:hypothetical protein